MDGTSWPSADQLNAPYAERWELLKDIMTRLYMDEKKKYKDIVKIMEKEYRFYASENQYKRQFGIWKLKRALPATKKSKICETIVTRAQQEKSSMVRYNGKVEVQKIRRHLKEQIRRDKSMLWNIGSDAIDIDNLSGHALQCGNRVFMNWSIPAAVLRFLKSKAANSPFSDPNSGSPMSGVTVATPSSNFGLSTQNPSSPGNAMSPASGGITAVVRESLKVKRAHMFIQKQHPDLLRGMTLQEQCVTTEWMHQFWQYAFTTAKTWGRGPRVWNRSNLRFDQFPNNMPRSLPSTPAAIIDSPGQHFRSVLLSGRSPESPKIQRPTDLCRWSIHIGDFDYEGLPSPELEDPEDLENEKTWKNWTTSNTIHDFAESLQRNLESNDFSTVEAKELPISSSQIAIAARRSPDQLLEEGFGFSIMARNINLICDMTSHIRRRSFTLHNLFPLHLASSYLDGSKTCCKVFEHIVGRMSTGETSIRKLYMNHLNHTVLDNLMIAILKAHSSCPPIIVDEAFKKEHRFAGEEVDICGRWDADSDCIRELQANGSSIIPITWKHMFCHTSAQVVTHCIGILFSPYWAPDINTPSGLYLKRCRNEACGLKLQLKPLHTLVVTSVHLAQSGRDGETLFGMIACLLCLLKYGANPLLKANISLDALLGKDDNQECTHLELNPLELARGVPQDLVSKWQKECLIGWRVFCAILALSQREWAPQTLQQPEVSELGVRDIHENSFNIGFPFLDADSAENRESCVDENEYSDNDEKIHGFCSDHYDPDEEQITFFGKSKYLATLWAAVQTELLTYRRINDGDSWISANFDLNSVLESLETGSDLVINLVTKKMMKNFCSCGVFHNTAYLHPKVEEASAHYFSNLEDWSRSTYLEDEV